MKTQQTLTTLLLLMIGALIAPATAQQKNSKGQVDVTVRQLGQRGDSLYISLDIDMTRLRLDSRRSLTLVPTVETASRERQLPEIIINGRIRNKAYIREVALMRRSERPAPYAVVKATPKGNNKIEYRYALPYETWMADARLNLIEDLCGCAGHTQQVEVIPVASRIGVDDQYPSLAYIQPGIETVKRRNTQKECYLDFPVGSIDIDPRLGNNRKELEKIDRMTDEIKNDPNLDVTGFTIIGYASIEGTLARNKQLSEGRARALRQYIASHNRFPAGCYRVEFGGEDWDGLVQLVEASHMEAKEEVLSIIRDVPILEGRESKLMDLNGGRPYRYMLRNMFPQLRRALCRIDYNVREFTPEEARAIIQERPQQLSLDEMYRVAGTYSTGSAEFNQVFETAVRLFPDDDTANLNAANAALSRHDLEAAAQYLARITAETPQYNNSMGVYYYLWEDYPQAEAYLKKAQEAGLPEATANLQQLKKKTGR